MLGQATGPMPSLTDGGNGGAQYASGSGNTYDGQGIGPGGPDQRNPLVIPWDPTKLGPQAPSPSQLQANNNAAFWQNHYAPTQAALDMERAQINARMGRVGSSRQGPDYAGNDIGNRKIDNLLEQLGISQEDAARQPGLLQALHGIAQKKFGLTGDQYQGDLGYLNQLRGFNEQNRDLSLRDAGLQRDMSDRQRRSAAAAGGSTNTQGNRDTYNDILSQFGLASDKARFGYDTGLAGINDKDRTTRNRYAQDVQDDQKENLSFEESTKQANNRIKTLDLQAKAYGLDREELNNAFQRGIQALGLQNQMDVDQLTDMLGSVDIKQQMLGQQVADAALRSAGNFFQEPWDQKDHPYGS